MSIYDFTVKNQEGEDVSLADYKGKVLLIVNTATQCGFTNQYYELQQLYNIYHDSGLEILDFPCNQFGGQAPGTNEEIHTFCTGRFGITFPQFAKIDVNGPNEDPLFAWLKENSEFEGFGATQTAKDFEAAIAGAIPDYKTNPMIKWNFTKFLVDREGNINGRFEPTNMEPVRDRITALL